MNNIFLFYGDEPYVLEQKLSAWKAEFIKKYGEYNFCKLHVNEFTRNGEDAKAIQAIFNETNQAPFLSEKRLIIINDFFSLDADTMKESIERFKKIPESTIVIFKELKVDKRISFYKFLEKECKVEVFKKCDEKNPTELKALCETVVREAQRRNITINFENAKYLAELVNFSLMPILNELEKLSLYKPGQSIEKADIDTLVTSLHVPVIFELTDAISKRDAKNALRILHEMEQSDVEVPMIFAMIHRQFRILVQVKDAVDRGVPIGKLNSEISEHPFTLRVLSSQTQNFSTEQLKKIFASLLDIDRKFKTSEIKISADDHSELLGAIEQFCVKHATKA